MMDSQEEISPELTKLANSVPIELLRAGPKRYAGLNQKSDGKWRFVLFHTMPVTLIWTDWKEGFGSFTIRPGATNTRIDDYVINAKTLDIPASWAYATLETYVKRLDFVELSPESEGKLVKALFAASGIEMGEALFDALDTEMREEDRES